VSTQRIDLVESLELEEIAPRRSRRKNNLPIHMSSVVSITKTQITSLESSFDQV